ncbi:hypothetical protein [Nitratireductor sp. XY-223]|uniref:hypothetical protein n=1 Tax=Nitratireductor sp. XY-223 TaxID=2561926 RepID=UPI0010AA9275|nr:hypothetical protein [Nitratireductor sp. XY-223]
MISIIIAGRNDNYGGNFEERLFATTRYNLEALEARGIEAELVFVEWNPIPGRPLLSEEITAAFPNARCIIVEPAIHKLVSGNRNIELFEYHAKNAGAARAAGSWLLLTNPDNYFGDDILDFLQRGMYDAKTLYRAGWIDVEDETFVNDPQHSDAHADDTEPFCCASGDFIFCARSLFEEVGGFREDLTFTNTHKDSIFCMSVFERTGRTQKIGHTYHLHHDRPGQKKRRVEFDWGRVGRTRQETYGLVDGSVIATADRRMTVLSLPDHLARKAKNRRPPGPKVPKAYRAPQPPLLVRQARRLRRFIKRRYRNSKA